MSTERNNRIGLLSSFAPWGAKGTPLLPESLRRRWSQEPLPPWVLELMGMPPDERLGDLPPMPDVGPVQRERLLNFVAFLLRNRADEVRLVLVFADAIPLSLDLASLPFRTRTHNCLQTEGLLQAKDDLQAMSYSELLRIPAFGAKSVLDLACTVEAAARELQRASAIDSGGSGDGSRVQTDLLIAAAAEPWADQVASDDPRFKPLLPPGRGTFLERVDAVVANGSANECAALAQCLPGLRARVAAIASLPLEEALRDYLTAASRLSGTRLDGLLARLGWGGEPPATLQEVGDRLGVTRERVRQIEARTAERWASRTAYLPALTSAVKALEAVAPISVDAAAKLLKTKGIATNPFHPRSVIEAARVCGIATTLQVRTVKGAPMVLGTWKAGVASKLASYAIRQCGASGVSNLDEVVAQAASEDFRVTAEQASRLLKSIEDLQFLDDRWFWNPAAPLARNRLRNHCRKMLSVANPISLVKLREGVRREYTFRASSWPNRWPLRVPPVEIMRKFLRAHPEFICDESDRVFPKSILDYKEELGEVDRVLVEVFRAAPAGVLDRSSIREACLARGINPNSLEIGLTYSAVIEHLDQNIWGLRGIEIPTAAVEALRAANALRPKERRTHGFEWTEDGRIRVAARLPGRVANPVVGIPGAIRRYLAGKRFAAVADDGSDTGNVGVTEDGTAYGFGRFINQAGGDEGDFLVLDFDLATEQVLLRLTGPEILTSLAD